MRLIAFQNKDTHARARDVLINKRYMDDVIDANDSEDEIIRTKHEISEVLGTYGFKIKEWFSNNIAGGKVVDTKILGLKWNTTKDTLSVDIKSSEKVEIFTKRSILSQIASFWDPLGLYVAFLMKGRVIFQSVVRLKGHWDEEIQDVELQKKWKQWVSQIRDYSDVIVGRNLIPRRKMEKCSLVGFSDGSSLGFGCVVYLRWTNEDESEIDIKFIAAKGKVGPINGNTIPRMELSGCLILARLLHSIKVAIGEGLPIEKENVIYTDSSSVLHWVNSEAIQYRPYVKNKIIEIQDLHPVKEWRYIPSNKN